MGEAPMDGGWSWCIVLACFGQHVLVHGVIKSFGVLFVDIQRCHHTSAWFLSLVSGMAASLTFGLGSVATALSVRFTSRVVVFTGAVMSSSGLVASAFVPSAEWLFLTYGVISGTGFGLTYAPCIAMVSSYFNERRSLANGLGVSGSGIGCLSMALLVRYMVFEYTLSGALLISGAIALNVTVCAMLLRPREFYTNRPATALTSANAATFGLDDGERTVASNGPRAPNAFVSTNDDEIKLVQCNIIRSDSSGSIHIHDEIIPICKKDKLRRNVSKPNSVFDMEIKPLSINSCENDDSERPNGCMKYCNLRLLQNPLFVIYTIGIVFAQFSIGTIFMMLPPFAHDRGYSELKGSLLPSIVGAMDLTSRLLVGWIADKQFIPRRYIYSLSITVLGVVTALLPMARGFVLIASFCGIYGLLCGCVIATMAVVIVDAAGPMNRFPAIGLVMVFQSMAMFPSSLAAGALRDITGSWDSSFHVTGAVAVVGGIVASLDTVIARWQRANH